MKTYIAAAIASVAFARQLSADYGDCYSCGYNAQPYQPTLTRRVNVPVEVEPVWRSAWNSAFDELDECTTCDDALNCYGQDCECAHEANTNSAFNRSFQKFSCNYKFTSEPKTYTGRWTQPAYSFTSRYVRPIATIAPAVDPRISERRLATIPEVNRRVVTATVPVYPNKDREHFEEKYEAPCMEQIRVSYPVSTYSPQPYTSYGGPELQYGDCKKCVTYDECEPCTRRGLAMPSYTRKVNVPVEVEPVWRSAWNSAFDELDECTTCDDALNCYGQDCECAHEANTNSAFNRSFQKFSCNYKFTSEPKTYTGRWTQPAYSFTSRYVRPIATIAPAVDPRISDRRLATIPEVNRRVVTATVPVYPNKDREHFEEKYEAPCMEQIKVSYPVSTYSPQPYTSYGGPELQYGDCKRCIPSYDNCKSCSY